MHAEPEPKALAMPPSIASAPPTAGEWTIGIIFILATLALVALIGWSIWMMAP